MPSGRCALALGAISCEVPSLMRAGSGLSLPRDDRRPGPFLLCASVPSVREVFFCALERITEVSPAAGFHIVMAWRLFFSSLAAGRGNSWRKRGLTRSGVQL
jgi:hypothetical protein